LAGQYACLCSKKVLLIIPALFVTTVIIFLLLRLKPGSVVDVISAELEAVAGCEEISMGRVFRQNA
jgi:ABC-type dipeptide/oligopeptide/nickel transport system permease component